MRLAPRLMGALLAGGHVRSPVEDWPPSLWPNHGSAGIRNRRRVFRSNPSTMASAAATARPRRPECRRRGLTQPGLPMKKGRSATMTHDYKRHGTTTLFEDKLQLGQQCFEDYNFTFSEIFSAADSLWPA